MSGGGDEFGRIHIEPAHRVVAETVRARVYADYDHREAVDVKCDDFDRVTFYICVAPEQKEVMRVIQMEQAQASRALQRLKDTGQVRSLRDKDDRRSWKFELTEDGRAALLSVLPAMERRRDETDAALNDEEMAQLKRLMTKVARSLVTSDGAKTWDRTRFLGTGSAGMTNTPGRRNG